MVWKAGVEEYRSGGKVGYADMDVLLPKVYDELTHQEMGEGSWWRRCNELKPANLRVGFNRKKQLQKRGRKAWEIYPDPKDDVDRLYFWVTGNISPS